MNGPHNPIKWCDYTWNPVKGKCPVACPYCYARRIYDRFHYDPTIRMDTKELMVIRKVKKPARIFVGSTIELFGDWIPNKWIFAILEQVRKHPQHTFQFLTKFPARMAQFLFPDNCWCGATIEDEDAVQRLDHSWRFESKPVKFLSFEPLHSSFQMYSTVFAYFNWFIIGAETGNRKGKIAPKEEWIAGLIHQAYLYDIPVYMKDNLKPYWHGELRQEFPI